MSKRRSLGEALSTDPAIAEFIATGEPMVTNADTDPDRKRAKQSDPSPKRSRRPLADAKVQDKSSQTLSKASSAPGLQSAGTRRRSRRKVAPAPQASEARKRLVPLNTRIEEATHKALTRAYLENKLRDSAQFSTQQEIVDQAIRDWLLRQGVI